jgi:quercetin dioxygenase-like cupin family protein
MAEPARSVRLDDIPTLASEPGGPEWKPIRLHFDIAGFGVNAWKAGEAGQLVIERHTETEDSDTRHQELYFVVRGHATFTVDGETVDAPAGTLVYVPDPDSVREATAEEADTVVLVVGAAAGEAFTPSSWETKYA